MSDRKDWLEQAYSNFQELAAKGDYPTSLEVIREVHDTDPVEAMKMWDELCSMPLSTFLKKSPFV